MCVFFFLLRRVGGLGAEGGGGVQTHAAQTARLAASNDSYINNGGACYYDCY